MRRWFSGRILACHAGGPGSIPGRRITFAEFHSKLNNLIELNICSEKTILNFPSNSNHLEILFHI